MALKTIDRYGPPEYGPLGTPVAGLILHTPENVDHTLAEALSVAKWQATAGNTSGGSYHGILAYDASAGGMEDPAAWVMVRTVPWNRASGGVTTRRDAIWAPSRYPFIKAAVSPAAYSDPNKYFHQIAISGKAAWYSTNGYPKGLVTALAMWVRELESSYKYDAVITLHRMWQTNRSDPGPLSLRDLVLAEYQRLYTVVEPVPPVVPAEPVEPVVNALDAAIDRVDAKLAEIDALVSSVRASLAYIKAKYDVQ